MNKYKGFEDSEYLNLTGRRKDEIVSALRSKGYNYGDITLLFGDKLKGLPTSVSDLSKLELKIETLASSVDFLAMSEEQRQKKIKTLEKLASDSLDTYNELFGSTSGSFNLGDFLTNVAEGAGFLQKDEEEDEREDGFTFDDDDNGKDDDDNKIGTLGWIGIGLGALVVISVTTYLIRRNK
jgi:hypothetical protein